MVATMIELFYSSDPSQININQQLKALDMYSKRQLYNANMYLSKQEVQRGDLYILNQGHLPMYSDIKPNMKTVQFGMEGEPVRRKKSYVTECSDFSFGVSLLPPYLIEGTEFHAQNGESLGYSFFGFTKPFQKFAISRALLKQENIVIDDDEYDPPYNGVTLLVHADQVIPPDYPSLELSYTINKKNPKFPPLRGLDINTVHKEGKLGSFNDIIILGHLPNMLENKVKISTGGGNDSLIIHGMVGYCGTTATTVFYCFGARLQADLGKNGYNSLLFDGTKAPELETIKYSSKSGTVRYLYFISDKSSHIDSFVGKIFNVQEVLFNHKKKSLVKMFAPRRNPSYKFDFTVITLSGNTGYIIDMAELAHVEPGNTVQFKIIDATENEKGADENYGSNDQVSLDFCDGHEIKMRIENFSPFAVENDVIYEDNKMKIYGTRGTVDISYRYHKGCSGTRKKRQKGGEKKELLATVEFRLKCPITIKSTNAENKCMMPDKTVSMEDVSLDLALYGGKRLVHDFGVQVTRGSEKNDHIYLKCPDEPIDNSKLSLVEREWYLDFLEGDKDTLVIGWDSFIEPCLMEESSNSDAKKSMILQRHHRNYSQITFTDVDPLGGGKEMRMRDIDQIVNEFGVVIFDFNIPFHKDEHLIEYDLMDLYRKKTLGKNADFVGEERTAEVRENLITCLKPQMEMSEEERELCLFDEDASGSGSGESLVL